MFDKNIVSEKYRDFNLISEEKKNDYLNANPFPSIILDDFFNVTFLNKVLEEFPDLSKIDSSQNYKNKNEVKYTNNTYKIFPNTIKQLFDFMNSNSFLEFLQKITSIEEKLISDKDLNGGGLHEIKTGGKLKVHTDFNRHPTLDLDRRINILIYLNKNWDKNYGGDLEFWNQNMSLCKKKYSKLKKSF